MGQVIRDPLFKMGRGAGGVMDSRRSVIRGPPTPRGAGSNGAKLINEASHHFVWHTPISCIAFCIQLHYCDLLAAAQPLHRRGGPRDPSQCGAARG